MTAALADSAVLMPRTQESDTMTTIDTRDLETVSGGILDSNASRPTLPPGDLVAPPRIKLPVPPSTIPLGPFYPPTTNPNIA